MPATEKPQRRTWRDLMEPGEPEPETLTRPAFVARLQSEGLDISPRTLAYWESEGIIPRSIRAWRDGAPQSLYPPWMLSVVRTVRGMQAQGLTLRQIREAVQSTPWRTPMAPPGEVPATRAELADRWETYSRASEILAPHIAELARLRERAAGVRIVDVTIQFRDANGTITSHGFGAPFAWLGDDANE